MFSLLKSLYSIFSDDSEHDEEGRDEHEHKDRNHDEWTNLIKKNSEHFTVVIDWEFKHYDVLVFKCGDKTVKVQSYLGHERECPKYISLKFNSDNGNSDNGNSDNGNSDNGNSDNGNSDNVINITGCDNNVVINKQLRLMAGTVVYLENVDLVC